MKGIFDWNVILTESVAYFYESVWLCYTSACFDLGRYAYLIGGLLLRDSFYCNIFALLLVQYTSYDSSSVVLNKRVKVYV
jgi:hypothetical protein